MTSGVCVVLGLTGRNFAAGMSGGCAYVYDVDGSFVGGKVNSEMVELCPLDKKEDRELVHGLLQEFVEHTGSVVAKDVLNSWPGICSKFVKVFPYEYQRALKSLQAEETECEAENVTNDHDDEPKVKDIEEAVIDGSAEKRKLDKILDKTRGFIKYKRETGLYRDATERQKDWNEVYNLPHVRKNLKTQAARCMECGVPFCQSNSHGCPLGNIIPKWNDLVFHGEWREALNQV